MSETKNATNFTNSNSSNGGMFSAAQPGANASRFTVLVRIPQESAPATGFRNETAKFGRVFLRDPDQDGGRRQPLAGQQKTSTLPGS
jgi:hypothetical protein